MPGSTRSAMKQAKLEDVGAGNQNMKPAAKPAKPSAAGKKRKANDAPKDDVKRNAKQAKARQRPKLATMTAICVAHFQYPNLSWGTCLSAGGAISTITAISKGRSIGIVDKPDPGEAQAKAERRKEQADKDQLDELKVMSFNLRLKDDQTMVGDKPKKAGEEALRNKYGGGEQYDKVKSAFEEALQAWKGKEDELDKRAFHMYEDFTPNVKPCQAGWGRKGQLSLQTIRSVVGNVG